MHALRLPDRALPPTPPVCAVILAVAIASVPAATKDGNAQQNSAAAQLELLATAGLTAVGATVEELGSAFAFTEGPARAADGAVFFTDQPNNRIHKWTSDSGISLFLEPAFRANGMALDAMGNLIVCAEERNALKRLGRDGAYEILADTFAGRPLNGPNDVWVAPDGAMYFTDPFYRREWGRHDRPPQEMQAVYRVDTGGTLRRVATDLKQPNGIVGSSDGTVLFVADIGAGRTWRYEIAPGGDLTAKRLLCELGSDGMTLDERGNVYLTGRDGVTVVSSAGDMLGKIPVPGGWTANVCFGGPERNILFLTATRGVYGLRMAVCGF